MFDTNLVATLKLTKVDIVIDVIKQFIRKVVESSCHKQLLLIIILVQMTWDKWCKNKL